MHRVVVMPAELCIWHVRMCLSMQGLLRTLPLTLVYLIRTTESWDSTFLMGASKSSLLASNV